jgi:hypothetical protein
MQLSAAVLMVVGTCLLAAAAYALFAFRARRRPKDLGVISEQWIAQHRASSRDENR